MASARRNRSPWQEALDVGSVGLEMAIAIAIGYFGGGWLDGALGTGAVLRWVGFGFGLLAAANAVYRVARRYMRDDDRGGDGQAGSGDRSV